MNRHTDDKNRGNMRFIREIRGERNKKPEFMTLPRKGMDGLGWY